MTIVLFTRNGDIWALKETTLFSKTIQLSAEVKYHGLTSDKWLPRKEQQDKVMAKTYKAFWTCTAMFEKTRELKLKMLHWIYSRAVRSMITYAAMWWSRIKFKTSTPRHSKLQSAACF
jgi:hypothetical protein